MIQVTELNNDARQEITLTTSTGLEIPFLIQFRPTQESWFFDLTYEDITINGRRLCNHPNMLRQWKNILPFGLACTVTDGGEPYFVDDFVTGRISLYVLSEYEVATIEELYF